MREIKFKIFDNNKLYAYATLWTWPWQRKLFSSPNLFQTLSFDCYEHQLWFDFSQEIDKYELMQFTWLLDKNWKEVYESDIITVINNNDFKMWWDSK